ncbi:hypothetical protein [Streptomyces sp. NPDC050287]|uniref:hypothetical protein n=1 Tax=Streptomyces sp. NPDC050287 TaxID=3365608 RepID=UPI00378D40BF
MTSPRMRTFISGLVPVSLAVGLTALAPGPAAAEDSRPGRQGPLPDSFSSASTGPPISLEPDATHPMVPVKDPAVFRCGNRWHVCATTAGTATLAEFPSGFRDTAVVPSSPQGELRGRTNPTC